MNFYSEQCEWEQCLIEFLLSAWEAKLPSIKMSRRGRNGRRDGRGSREERGHQTLNDIIGGPFPGPSSHFPYPYPGQYCYPSTGLPPAVSRGPLLFPHGNNAVPGQLPPLRTGGHPLSLLGPLPSVNDIIPRPSLPNAPIPQFPWGYDEKGLGEASKGKNKKSGSGKQRTTCRVCNLIFPEKSDLWIHTFANHPERQHKCPKCSKEFFWQRESY